MINLNTTIAKKIPVGEYSTKLISFENIDNEKGGYLKIQLELTLDDGEKRTLNQNIFPKNVEYLMSCLRRQFELQNEDVSYLDILNKAQETEFKSYISYNDYGLNVAYSTPSATAAPVDLNDIQA